MFSPLKLLASSGRWTIFVVAGALTAFLVIANFAGTNSPASPSAAVAAPASAGAFVVVGQTIFAGGCGDLDLHQVTYLAPDGSSTHQMRWCA